MPRLIERPTIIEAAGNKPKTIEEYAGHVNSGHANVSIARMVSPEGWLEPGQRPEFEEITVVIRGLLRVEFKGGVLDVRCGQAVVASPGEWVRYSSPEPGGAEYIAVCIPAFTPDTVHRDPE
jgi:mannose-6-phosphate isomerase-like protein (cupin superfamily)